MLSRVAPQVAVSRLMGGAVGARGVAYETADVDGVLSAD